MNKSERLNDELLFLNNKSYFNLKDLVERYSISKRTAIRDVQALESLGMPIYSKSGRNGCYGILKNRLLSPILFTLDEVFALYFSMLTLKAYETTPFHLDIDKLKQKFGKCLSTDQNYKLNKIESIFSLGVIQHNNYCYFLKDILQAIIDEKVCRIQYKKDNNIKEYQVQFFNISSSFGQWYVSGYNFETENIRIFRCDKIQNMKRDSTYSPKPFVYIEELIKQAFKISKSTEFEIEVTSKGADLFYKEHYPSMKIFFENEKYIIKGNYNKNEESFISQYVIGFGNNILSLKPKELKELVLEKLKNTMNYIQSVWYYIIKYKLSW